jgi:drug/metabolite transporter (DMT)-like permease
VVLVVCREGVRGGEAREGASFSMSGVPLWIWVVVAFGAAAAWGLTVVVNKRTLQYVDPFALNLVVRVPTIVLIAVVTVVLTLASAWDLGFGVTWRSFGCITLSAVSYHLLIDQIGSVLTMLIIASSPVFAILGGMRFLGERHSWKLVIGTGVTLSGVAIATLQGV